MGQSEKERIMEKWDKERKRELKGNETKWERENYGEMRQIEKERIKGKWDKERKRELKDSILNKSRIRELSALKK